MKIFITLLILLFSVQLFAQSQTVVDKPAITRKVSGIVKDNFDNPLNNAEIDLFSKSDTFKTKTYFDGMFFFNNVKRPLFVLMVTRDGYVPFAGRYRWNDTSKNIGLDPIELRAAITSRQVSGIVKDEAGIGLSGIRLTLTSVSDTLGAVTNNEGIFIFDEVKQARFTVSVTGDGYQSFVSNYSYSEIAKKLVLNPITLKRR